MSISAQKKTIEGILRIDPAPEILRFVVTILRDLVI